MIRKRIICRSILGIAFLFLSQISVQAASFVAHEWGTFTSLQGSDGQEQEGMHHEDEHLPSFVHGRDPQHESGLERCCDVKCMETCSNGKFSFPVTQKMETPVLYFYSSEPQKLEVNVRFPSGIISQYFPNPTYFTPLIGKLDKLEGSNVNFGVNLVKNTLLLPKVDPQNIYSPARNVNSDFINAGNENEKFIFYRGLGKFSTSFAATSKEGALTIRNNGSGKYSAVFLVKSAQSTGYIKFLGSLSGKSSIYLSSQNLADIEKERVPLNKYLEVGARLLKEELQKTGLFEDEALAMVNTWKANYFKTPGMRVLYFLPRNEIDNILPLKIQPRAESLVRTFVGRVEIFLDTDETQLIQEIHLKKEHVDLENLGRFAEAKLRRVSQLVFNPQDFGIISDLINLVH